MNGIKKLFNTGMLCLLFSSQMAYSNSTAVGLNTCRPFYERYFKTSYTSQTNLNRLSLEPFSIVVGTGGESPDIQMRALKDVNWLQWIGKKIIFDMNSPDPRKRYTRPDILQVPQVVLSFEMLDKTAKNLVTEILQKSGQINHSVEVGVLEVVFKDGRRKTSNIFLGEEHTIDIYADLKQLTSEVDWTAVAEVRFFHTHPTEVVSPLSLSDKFLLNEKMELFIPNKIPVHMFAIPAHQYGKIIFFQTRLPDETRQRLKSTRINHSSKKIISDHSSLSADEIFGPGKKIIIGINRSGRLYFVVNDRRFQMSEKYGAEILSENSDQLDDGDFFVLNAPSDSFHTENFKKKSRSVFQRYLNPYDAFFSELNRLTGITLKVPFLKGLRLKPNDILNLIRQTGFKDSTGRPLLAEHWQFQKRDSGKNNTPEHAGTQAVPPKMYRLLEDRNKILGQTKRYDDLDPLDFFVVESGPQVFTVKKSSLSSESERYEEIIIEPTSRKGISVSPIPSAKNLFQYPYFQIKMGIRILPDEKTMVRPSNAHAYNRSIVKYNESVSDAEKIPFLVKDDFSTKGKTSEEVVRDWIEGFVFLNQRNPQLHIHDNTFHMDRFFHLPALVMHRSMYNYSILTKLIDSELFKGNEGARLYVYDHLGTGIDFKTSPITNDMEIAKRNWNDLILDPNKILKDFETLGILSPEQVDALKTTLTYFVPLLSAQEAQEQYEIVYRRMYSINKNN